MASTVEKSNVLDKHLHHLGQHHGDLAGHERATKRDHDFLSQIRVIPTNSGHEIVSIPVPMTLKSQIGNPVSAQREKIALTIDSFTDSSRNWCICHNSNNTILVSDGMERSFLKQCFYWQLPLCSWYRNGCFGTVGARVGQQLCIYCAISLWFLLWRIRCNHHSHLRSSGGLWWGCC